MGYELAVVGLGNTSRQDRGIGIYLLDSLQDRFSKYPIKFINGGVDGRDLFNLLQQLTVKKVIVLDTVEKIESPGSLNYLTMALDQAGRLEKLMIITIEVFETDWGSELSFPLVKKYKEISTEIESVIEQMLTRPLRINP
ncbi:hydrogenase maturation protease [Acetohalobium arabaticum]|uniref:Hydrogenase maturation protease n=1 Tax=Acetohalobium arabaticum (strain ATCC 49924 / DSM 5501 / Z-7288) TaxID=574087 RepID=D9QRZ9_ACEAZ|nr:hydrogenase maturation protease [Acetohalobium arabaticum]ADL13290.1 hydrogenase maturation protease [Acetohalobium arabaticum DSM 5501]